MTTHPEDSRQHRVPSRPLTVGDLVDGGVVPNSLPLLDRVDGQGAYSPHGSLAGAPVARFTQGLVPDRAPGAGEQYRFHFDMTKCVGCKCCVVACTEQNNNPAAVSWRRVGELEGGTYPHTRRHYVSMGCNHCVDPACLNGCPTEAYVKADDTGLVFHNAEDCIGCQYCTWNCPYGVPQYNPERKVVGKCDMCHGRLADGMAPACVSACPQEALAIEIVKVDDWLAQTQADAEAPEVPESGITLSTTRITLPKDLPVEMLKADAHLLQPEHPHTPLIFLTVLTQVGLGAALGAMAVELATAADWVQHVAAPALWLAAAMLGVTGMGLNASLFHLGRPIHAWKAFRGWRKSWLSREAIGLTLFFGAMHAYVGAAAARYFLDVSWAGPLAATAAVATVVLGIGGVYCSARLYKVPARPSWNTVFTVPHFFLPGAAVGLLLCAAVFAAAGSPAAHWLAGAGAVGAAVNLLMITAYTAALLFHEQPELRRTGLLYTRRFQNLNLLRLGAWLVAACVLPWVLTGAAALGVATAAALLSLFAARYLFFVTVVPKNIPGQFFTGSGGGAH